MFEPITFPSISIKRDAFLCVIRRQNKSKKTDLYLKVDWKLRWIISFPFVCCCCWFFFQILIPLSGSACVYGRDLVCDCPLRLKITKNCGGSFQWVSFRLRFFAVIAPRCITVNKASIIWKRREGLCVSERESNRAKNLLVIDHPRFVLPLNLNNFRHLKFISLTIPDNTTNDIRRIVLCVWRTLFLFESIFRCAFIFQHF